MQIGISGTTDFGCFGRVFSDIVPRPINDGIFPGTGVYLLAFSPFATVALYNTSKYWTYPPPLPSPCVSIVELRVT